MKNLLPRGLSSWLNWKVATIWVGSLSAIALVLPACVADIIVDATKPGLSAGRFLGGSVILWQQKGQGILTTSGGPSSIHPRALSEVKDLGVSLLRFGDAASEQYNWRDGVGPGRPLRRPPWNEWPSPNDMGIAEAVAYARAVGAELIVVVPLRDTRDFSLDDAPSGVQLAANFVEFCNGVSPGLQYGRQQGWQPTSWVGPDVQRGGTADSGKRELKVPGSYLAGEKAPEGYFAWLREFFGHPEPFNIRFWEIGNETYLFNRAGKAWATPQSYRELFVQFSDAMKAKDPTILVGAQGWTHNILSSQPERSSEGYIWSRGVFGQDPDFTEAFKKADFITLHEYVGPQAPNTQSQDSEYRVLSESVTDLEQRIRRFQELFPKPVFVTEYHVQYGVFGQANPEDRKHQHRLKSALAIARMQHVFLRRQVDAACIYHLLDLASGPGGWLYYPTFRLIYDEIDRDTRERRQGVSVPYLALKLYNSRTPGRYVLPVSMPDLLPSLDVVALRKPNATLSLIVINASASQDVTSGVQLNGFVPAARATVSTLNSPDGMEGCTYVDSSRVGITTSEIAIPGPSFTYTFPAHSLTVIDLEPKGSDQVDPEPPPGSDPPPLPDPEPHNPNPAGIEVQVTANNPAPLPGDTVTFTSVCRNLGSSTVEQTTVTFLVPDGMELIPGSITPPGAYSPITRRVEWLVTSLKPGQSRQLRCSARVK